MVKIGFIVEGDAEKIILESTKFKEFLQSLNLLSVGIFDAGGEGNFKVESIKVMRFCTILSDRGAEHIVIWTDMEDDPCITFTLESIHRFDKKKQVVLISVRSLESWFLADFETLSLILNSKVYYKNPETIPQRPFDEIKDLFIKYTGRGISKRKNRLAYKMVSNGFSVETAARHPGCKSAGYFINKLRVLSQNN